MILAKLQTVLGQIRKVGAKKTPIVFHILLRLLLQTRVFMAATRTVWQKDLKFGTLIRYKPLILFTKFWHPPQIWKYVYANKPLFISVVDVMHSLKSISAILDFFIFF